MVKLLGIKILGFRRCLQNIPFNNEEIPPNPPSPANAWQTNNASNWQWNDSTDIQTNN